MACLDTYKRSDQKGQYPPMSPRLSFSNDFVESSHHPSPTNTANNIQDQNIPPNISAPSDDFEFSANPSNHTAMTAADQLFFKGKLLPTLRDELLLNDDDDDAAVPPKGLPRWKEFLSLKRSVVDGRCTATDNNGGNQQGKIPKLTLHDKTSSHLPMTS